jgi:hypothetical protein
MSSNVVWVFLPWDAGWSRRQRRRHAQPPGAPFSSRQATDGIRVPGSAAQEREERKEKSNDRRRRKKTVRASDDGGGQRQRGKQWAKRKQDRKMPPSDRHKRALPQLAPDEWWPQGQRPEKIRHHSPSRATVGGTGQLRSYAKHANRRHLWWAGMCMMCREKILGHWTNGPGLEWGR